MITNPDEFFGRNEQINDIITRLRNMQSSSIVGERRIGKSSLLYHLTQTGAQKIADSNYCFFYFDFQDARLHNADGFFQTVLVELGGSPEAIKTENTPNKNLIAFTDQIEAMERSGRRIILCLDEFENAFKHRAEFTEDFFDHMRSQLNLRRLAFVTSTRKGLQDLCLEGRLVSPFYNIFTVVALKELTEEEARGFVEAHRERVNFTESELEFIFSYLNPHPLKLQILCDWVIKNRQQRLRNKELIEEINKEGGNFFVGRYDSRNLRRWKRLGKIFSLDKIKKLFEMIKAGRDIFPGSKEK